MTPLYISTNFDQNSFKTCLMTHTQPKKTSWRSWPSYFSLRKAWTQNTHWAKTMCALTGSPAVDAFFSIVVFDCIHVCIFIWILSLLFLVFMWIYCAAGEGGGIPFIFIHTNPYTVLVYIFYLQCRGVKISLACRPHAAPFDFKWVKPVKLSFSVIAKFNYTFNSWATVHLSFYTVLVNQRNLSVWLFGVNV